jgi:hypothetical protein
MKITKILWPMVLTGLIAALMSSLSWSQQGAVPGTAPVSMIVSVEARHGKDVPTVYKEDVRVSHGNDRLPLTGWTPCQSDQTGLQLFVLVDDTANADLGLQLDDLKKFMEAQPPTTAIGVGYARNATVLITQNLTKDHAQAAKALRLPQGFGAMNSPYLSVTDLVKGWPQSPACREILMISSGIDFLQGGPDDSYLLEAIEHAQRAAIQVYAIYAATVGHAGHSFFRINWGQNNLARLTEETGGEFYIQGLTPPISYTPYLRELSERFNHQFNLTFAAKPANKAGLQHIKLETEVNNAELVGQENVYVPAAK